MQSKILEMWGKLAKRERLVLSIGGALVVMILLVQLVFVPYVGARKKLTKTIRVQEKVLKEMRDLSVQYEGLRRGMDAVQTGLARRDPAFTLFSSVEKKAAAAGVRSYIRNMQPSRKPIPGGYAESSLEMALERITLRQLTGFLQAVETSEDMIRVRRLAVRKGSDNPQYLSAVIQLATIERDSTGGQP